MSTLSLRKIKHDSSAVDNITLDSNGRVGVQQASPNVPLEVSGSWRLGTNTSGAYTGGLGGGFNASNNIYSVYCRDRSDTNWNDLWIESKTMRLKVNGSDTAIYMDQSGRVTMPYQPTFFAYGATNTNNTVCVYPSTTVNKGSCYNTSNGRFTAPISGTYYIVWGNLSSNANDVYRFYLRKNGAQGNVGNGDVHCRLDTGASGSEYIQGSRSYMLNLVAGDYLDIYLTIDSGNAPHSGSDYHWFSGWLHS